MKKSSVHFIEIVHDPEPEKLEKTATETVRRFYPDSTAVKLYRMADGKIGCQMQIAVAPGERKPIHEAYRAVMKVLGEKRGRRAGRGLRQQPEPSDAA